jgi:UDP-N-acetylmuramoylalanine--D-glutamate ligase
MNITIIGAARSGLAAAELAVSKGEKVFLTESKPIESFVGISERLNNLQIESEFGCNSEKALKGAELIITSPGVLPTAPVIVEAEKLGIPIISELEYASSMMKNPLIAITGTNGKTTTTTLTAYILNKSGRKAVAAGNIGEPLSSFVGKISDDTIVVAEVSSFQLDRIVDFKPKVAVLLNITPDHLYYHGSMEKYIEAKFKITLNQNEKDFLILNADDAIVFGGKTKTKANVVPFSLSELKVGIFKSGSEMRINFLNQHNEEKIMLFDEIRLPGVHNAYNSMAAAAAARVFEIRNEDIRDCLMSFEGVEHRLEFVRSLNGVDYINDSKATNINAAWYALSSYRKPLVWIAGGRGDSNDYSALDKFVEQNVKCIVAIGEEADAIFNHFSSKVRCFKESMLETAVERARSESQAGDVVLFSPACKSFDMFINYEHRGEVFKEIVNGL